MPPWPVVCVCVYVVVCVCVRVCTNWTHWGAALCECLDYCIDATLNTFQHSYPLYYCISCMWCYSCQKEHIYACSNLPFLSFDRVLSTVEPTGLQAAHCNILLISAQPLLSVCRHKTAVSVCLWLFYWCDADCVFFVFGCLLSNVKLWVFFYVLSVVFGPKRWLC